MVMSRASLPFLPPRGLAKFKPQASRHAPPLACCTTRMPHSAKPNPHPYAPTNADESPDLDHDGPVDALPGRPRRIAGELGPWILLITCTDAAIITMLGP